MNISLYSDVRDAIDRAADKDYAHDRSSWVVAQLVRILKRRKELP